MWDSDERIGGGEDAKLHLRNICIKVGKIIIKTTTSSEVVAKTLLLWSLYFKCDFTNKAKPAAISEATHSEVHITMGKEQGYSQCSAWC